MLDEVTIQKLKDTHGTIMLVIASDGTELVFRKPRRQEFNAWFDKRDEEPTKSAYHLALQTVVYPDQGTLTSALDKQPALLTCKDGVMDALTDLAGMAAGGSAQKKLL